ncbi:MAG: 3'-5' exonuclease, partial [Candidatus Micrarchaeota archaeon]|nr:3'-5' exonuclease [Candidatus Micrarchaeota archaeon]
MRAWLLDVDYVHTRRAIRLLLKAHGKTLRAYAKFEPYFYLQPDSKDAEEKLKNVTVLDGDKSEHILKSEWVDRFLDGKSVRLLKIVVGHPGLVPRFQDAVKHLGQTYEFGILFTRRYLIDNGLVPHSLVDVTLDEKKWVQSIAPLPTEGMPDWNMLSLDIETYNPTGMPDAKKDPAIMVSLADDQSSSVITYKKRTEEFAESVDSEKAMLERLCAVLLEKK